MTQTSGRGLGLDIVHDHVLGQGGYLTLDSELDKGSTIELHLPARPR